MKTLTAIEIIQILEDQSEHGYYRTRRIIKEASVKEIISALKQSETPLTREILCDILGNVRAKSAVPILIDCLDDPSSGVRSSAADSLGKIGSPTAGEALMYRFAHVEQDKNVRSWLASALGAVGHRPAIPLLIETLRDPYWNTYSAAAWSLGVLRATEALDALEQALLGAEDGYPRRTIEDAIELIKNEG